MTDVAEIERVESQDENEFVHNDGRRYRPVAMPGLGHYVVSSDGTSILKRAWNDRDMTIYEMAGYARVSLTREDGERISLPVHQVVAYTYLISNAVNPTCHTVDHIKSDEPLNNDVSNLRWATKRQQCLNQSRLEQRRVHPPPPEDAIWAPLHINGQDIEVSDVGGYIRGGGRALPRKGCEDPSNKYWKHSIKGKDHYAHVLVAAAWLGPRPDGHVVNHKDERRDNNSLTNLEYVTKSQNGTHSRLAFKPVVQYRDRGLTDAVATYPSLRDAARRTRTRPQLISQAVKKAYGATAVGDGVKYFWRFADT
jgi:hypothetical protein